MSDREYFLHLFKDSEQDIYRYVAAIVPNFSDSQDIVQQTAAILWEKFAHYDSSKPFTPWACRFARNVALNWMSKQTRWKTFAESGLVDVLTQKQASLRQDFDVRLDYLSDCLRQLPEDQREMIQGYYSGMLDIEMVAQRGKRTVAATYKSLQRIRKRLKKCIENQQSGITSQDVP